MIVKTEYDALQQLIDYDCIYGGGDNQVWLAVFYSSGLLYGIYSSLTANFDYDKSDSFIISDTAVIELQRMTEQYNCKCYAFITVIDSYKFQISYKLDNGLTIDAGIYDSNFALRLYSPPRFVKGV